MNHHRNGIRALTVTLAAAGLVVAGALTAWAHVEVEAEPAVAGATDVTLTFHVPNEEAPAVTTQVTFVMPSDQPLVGVTAKPQNGFRPTTTSRHLAVAVPGSGGPVSEVATQVTFSGGRIAGKDEKPFVLNVDKLPAGVRALTFKVLQQYSNGTIVSWIEVAADGAAEPEHPAPVLTLAAPAASPSGSATATATATSPENARATAAQAVPQTSSPDGGGAPWAPLAVGGAVVAAAVAAFLFLRRRAGQQ